MKVRHPECIHLDEVAVVCLGDYLSSLYVFKEDEAVAMNSAIETAISILENNRLFALKNAIKFHSNWGIC